MSTSGMTSSTASLSAAPSIATRHDSASDSDKSEFHRPEYLRSSSATGSYGGSGSGSGLGSCSGGSGSGSGSGSSRSGSGVGVGVGSRFPRNKRASFAPDDGGGFSSNPPSTGVSSRCESPFHSPFAGPHLYGGRTSTTKNTTNNSHNQSSKSNNANVPADASLEALPTPIAPTPNSTLAHSSNSTSTSTSTSTRVACSP
jgi:hypothetical protein